MASTYLQRITEAGSTGKKWTFSVWLKRSSPSVSSHIWNCSSDDDSSHYIEICIKNTDKLDMQFRKGTSGDNGTFIRRITNRVFRDPNAWYHLVMRMDTTESSASDRFRVYVNGVQETSWDTETGTIPLNYQTEISTTGSENRIGRGAGSSSSYWDGSMSHLHFCDDYSYAPTVFGSTDSTTGEWKITTSPSVSYGTNGFFIFKDGNNLSGSTVQDQSGEGHNLSVENGTLTKTEDCPSNVFATLNPLDKAIVGTDPTFANGNTKWTSSGNNTSNNAVQGTIGASSGKYYFEIKATTANYLFVGMRNQNVTPSWDATGYSANNTGFYGVNNEGKKIVGGTGTNSIFTQISNNDIFCCAYDLDNKKFWVRTNDGAWYASGNPVTGANSLGTLADGTYLPIVFNGHYSYASACECNFGNGYFGTTQISSEGTNASGIGKFEDDVPTGYTALCTK